MDIPNENAYDYVLEVERLRKKLDDLKRKQNNARIKEQLTTLNTMYRQTEDSVYAIKSNLSKFNDNSHLLSQVLDHKTKIAMKEESANSVKGILSKISKVSAIGEPEALEKENMVNKIDNEVVENVSKHLDRIKSGYNSNWMLVNNVSKIVGGDKKDDTSENLREQKSRKSDGSASTMTFTYDNLVTSSPYFQKK